MRTLKSIEKEIPVAKEKIEALESIGGKKNISLAKKQRVRICELRQYIIYLETNPSREYLELQYQKLNIKIDYILESYVLPPNSGVFTKGILSKLRKEYEKEHGLPKFKKQLATISYILK